VQAHDFPDPDAAGAAYGLAGLLLAHGIQARATWQGMARSGSLANLALETGIDLHPLPPLPDEALVVVDGAPENGNVSVSGARLIAVIDHHEPAHEVVAPYVDIRPVAGACCSIISRYWKETGLEPHGGMATAMLAGLQSDTDFMSRGVSPIDIEAFSLLAPRADLGAAARMLKTNMNRAELVSIARALADASMTGERLLARASTCSQEALSIAADLALRAREVLIAVAYCEDGNSYRLSVRSRDARRPAFEIIRNLTKDIGSGGGHARSAGGIIYGASFPGDEELLKRLSLIP
jgi:nanoRNase/pAp phosphatase (c-di-AMP/oligoRNAs hydrolase)